MPSEETPAPDLSGLQDAYFYITSKKEIDVAEAVNIMKAMQKHFRGRKHAKSDWLTVSFVKQIHRDMFGEVWVWAGKYRDFNFPSMPFSLKRHQVLEAIEIMCGDLVLHHLGLPYPSWPSEIGSSEDKIRKEYINALRAADCGNYEPLVGLIEKWSF